MQSTDTIMQPDPQPEQPVESGLTAFVGAVQPEPVTPVQEPEAVAPATEPEPEPEKSAEEVLQTEAPVEDKPIKIAMSPEEQRIEDFRQQILANRAAAEEAAKPKPPGPMSEGQWRKIKEEQEAGRRAVANNRARRFAQTQPKHDPREGSNTPVLRPRDFVPNFNQGNTSAQQVRG